VEKTIKLKLIFCQEIHSLYINLALLPIVCVVIKCCSQFNVRAIVPIADSSISIIPCIQFANLYHCRVEIHWILIRLCTELTVCWLPRLLHACKSCFKQMLYSMIIMLQKMKCIKTACGIMTHVKVSLFDQPLKHCSMFFCQ